MVDLSKHLARSKQALSRRNYDLAIEICLECQEVDPANTDNMKLLIDAANRRAKEGKKGGFNLGFSLSRDPHKQLTSSLKRFSKSPDLKSAMAVGDAAVAVFDDGLKGVIDVAVLFYDEANREGLFNKDLLWNMGQGNFKRFQATKDPASLDKAIAAMADLHRQMPTHPEAGRTMKNWEATKSMTKRNVGSQKGAADDYRKQLASSGEARRNEVMNRVGAHG